MRDKGRDRIPYGEADEDTEVGSEGKAVESEKGKQKKRAGKK